MYARPLPSLDRIGIALSGLCVVHCLATSVLLALMSAAGGVLGNPLIHEVGLALAVVLGAVAMGRGALAHGLMLPTAIGSLGVGVMAGALNLPHGAGETMWTIVGVALLASAHVMNHRGCAGSGCFRVQVMAWITLIAAGLLEIVWAAAMKQSRGFTHFGWSALTICAMIASFALLSVSMKTLPLGTAYTIWTGIGAVGAFVVGVALLGEPASLARILAAVTIVGGLVAMKLAS